MTTSSRILTLLLLSSAIACQSLIKLKGGGASGAGSPDPKSDPPTATSNPAGNNSSNSSNNSSNSNKASASDAEVGDKPGERAQAAMAKAAAIEKVCPKTDEPPPTEEQCYAAIKEAENAFHRVGLDIELPQVRAARNVVYEADKLKHVWNKHRKGIASAKYRAEREYEESVRGLGNEFGLLKKGRDKKAGSPLTNRDADNAQTLKFMLANYKFGPIDEWAKARCGNSGDPRTDWETDQADRCDLAKNRKKYYRQWVEAGVDAAVLERVSDWENAVESLERGERLDIKNQAVLSTDKGLLKRVGKKANAIIAATGVKVSVKGTLKAKMSPLRKRYKKAVTKWASKSQWKKQSKGARHKDSGGKKALARGLKSRRMSVVKYGIHDAGWSVVMGKFDRPVERTKDTVVMARKKGESFCRIYHVRVVQDHKGGGRYGKTKAYTRGFDGFFVSKCR